MSKKAAVPKYSRLSSDSVFRACFDLFRHRQNLDHAYQELEQCRCVACGQFAVCIDIAVVALVCAQFHCAGDRLIDEDSVRDIHSAVQVHIPVEQLRCDLACGGLGLCGLDSVALSVVLSPGLVSVAVAVALDSAGFVSVAVAVSLDSAGFVSVADAVTLDSAGFVSVAEAVSLDCAGLVSVFVAVSVVAVVALVVVVVIGGCGVSISWKAAPECCTGCCFP